MIRSLMILLNALLMSVVTAFMDMKFGYHVIEGNARYLENIETNLANNTVKIHTPAHNDVMESYLLQDFRQGQQMKCLPSVKQCRLRDINRKTTADAGKITEGFIHSWNKGDTAVKSANEEVVNEMYYIDFDEVIDDTSLVESLTEFYQDFKYPIYKEKTLPQGAEILNVTRSEGGRVKRNIGTINSDCTGQVPKIVFGRDAGTSSHHLKICHINEMINGQWRLTDCGNIHILSPLIYHCICCP